MRKEQDLNPNNLSNDYNAVSCCLDCDQYQHGCKHALEIGNETYMNHLLTTKDWFTTKFVAGFMAMIQHDTHMPTPPFKIKDRIIMVPTHFPNKQILKVLSYGDATHLISVVFKTDHFVVLSYDIENCTVTVSDSLNASIRN